MLKNILKLSYSNNFNFKSIILKNFSKYNNFMDIKKSDLYINGSFVQSCSSNMLDCVNPATEEVFFQVPAANEEDANAAVNAASEAFDDWSNTTGSERAVYLRKIADRVTELQKEFAELETFDTGKPLPESVWDMEDVAGCFNYYADLAEKLDKKQNTNVDIDFPGFSAKLQYQASGVVALIVPFNYPLLMASWKVAPALAAGCTVVLKPSEYTSTTALAFSGVVDDIGLPAGVFNCLSGYGTDVGEPLVNHPLVDKVAFTGSTATGSRILAQSGNQVKSCSAELGGKSPAIIFSDSFKKNGVTNMAELDKLVEWVIFGFAWTNGQICSATSRVLIEESGREEFIERLKYRCEKIKIGNPMEEDTRLGPIISEKQYLKVINYINEGIDQGATLLTGGKRPENINKGYYVQPTVFINVTDQMSIWREEIFGPVLSIMDFQNEKQAIQLSNNTEYGLAAAVFSKDPERNERITRAFRTGIVWINCSQPCFVNLPWGGLKRSGVGRDIGEYGLDKFLEVKQIVTNNKNDPWNWYWQHDEQKSKL